LNHWHREQFPSATGDFFSDRLVAISSGESKIERYLNPWHSMSHIQAVSADAPAAPSKDQKRLLKARFEQAYLMTGVAARAFWKLTM